MARICSVEGCPKKHTAKGYCSMHYQRLTVKGDALAKTIVSEKHGLSGTKLHMVWSSMKARCNNPNAAQYHNYGARGIQVCERWQNSFLAFREDVGEKPGEGYSLDRINNDGNYEPGNVRWATKIEQGNNSRMTRRFEGKTIREWSEIFGVTMAAIKTVAFKYGLPYAIAYFRERPPRPRGYHGRYVKRDLPPKPTRAALKEQTK